MNQNNKEKTLRDLNPLDMKVSTAKKAGATLLKWAGICTVIIIVVTALVNL